MITRRSRSSLARFMRHPLPAAMALAGSILAAGCGGETDEPALVAHGALAPSVQVGTPAPTTSTPAPGGAAIPGGGPTCVAATPAHCTQAKHQEPAPPPLNYVLTQCTYEVSLTNVLVTDGQGISEGKLEIEVQSDAGAGSVRWPTGSDYMKMEKDFDKDPDQLVATYDVPKGTKKKIQICATVTEVDGGLNGDSDVGSDCETVTLECNRQALTAPPSDVMLSADLCRGNALDEYGECKHYNGRAHVSYHVTLSDRDYDGVPAHQDFTPDPEDEACRGQEGRAVVLFSQYGLSGLNDLIGQVGMGLDEMVEDYDFVAIAIDPLDPLGFTVRADTLARADKVVEPTLDGLVSAMRAATSRGFDISLYVAGHGAVVATNATFTSADPLGFIDEYGLRAALAPTVSGTCAIPIRMVYGIPCYFSQFDDTWTMLGAHVATGARFVNSYPQEGNGFARHWNNGDPFVPAVIASVDPVVRGINAAALNLVGQPMCFAQFGTADSPLGKNACADWFFTGGLATVNFGADYDPAVSGFDNMNGGAAQVVLGDGSITKFTPLTW